MFWHRNGQWCKKIRGKHHYFGTVALTGSSPKFSNVKAGNLVDDGIFIYTYDAWHRLVKVTMSEDTSTTIQTATFDGLGRRIKKTVTNAGDLDGTFVYYYNSQRIIEVRDGSGNVLQQAYHGTQYIDEVVAMKLKDGYAVVHQDANWNVIATTDLAGSVLETIFEEPYECVSVPPRVPE